MMMMDSKEANLGELNWKRRRQTEDIRWKFPLHPKCLHPKSEGKCGQVKDHAKLHGPFLRVEFYSECRKTFDEL